MVKASTGASGFTVLGNEVSSGKFRFVAYADPTAAMSMDEDAVIMFTLQAKTSLPKDGATTISFLNGPVDASDSDKAGESSAATLTGGSIDSVVFSSFQVTMTQIGRRQLVALRISLSLASMSRSVKGPVLRTGPFLIFLSENEDFLHERFGRLPTAGRCLDQDHRRALFLRIDQHRPAHGRGRRTGTHYGASLRRTKLQAR
jgi:hypothetical protein